MDIQDLIDTVLKNAKKMGTFPLPDLLKAAMKDKVSGIAIAPEPGIIACLAFVSGEPDGAIYIDAKGELYGDRAVMPLTHMDSFTLCEVQQDIVEALVMGCRIFEKNHLTRGSTHEIQEIGIKREAIGHLTLHIMKDREPQKGVRVTMRKDGRVVGSDVTFDDGSVGFRILFGIYECVVQNRSQSIRAFPVQFTEASPDQVIDL
ncbi:hypothetical protein [Methanoregula sp.]|uniref:hypothetical protein n=1 Tax=Methanoregula sp. TaxID=2052170 RepID=UPI00236F633F|nr:hypothetical protein [Methanoregula sp.]MDD1685500.1 hypothetical protein [Methanoregula sp.]